jgi:hypothetical protein
MTVGDWVSSRAGGAPPSLLNGVRQALGKEAGRPAAQAPGVLLDVAVRDLRSWLAGDATSRSAAVPLLTIDALATLAMEAAADDPVALNEFAEKAIHTIAEANP